MLGGAGAGVQPDQGGVSEAIAAHLLSTWFTPIDPASDSVIVKVQPAFVATAGKACHRSCCSLTAIDEACVQESCGGVIAVDGEALHGSRQQGATDAQLLAISGHRPVMVLGQVDVPNETNAVPTAGEHPLHLALEGPICTANAAEWCDKNGVCLATPIAHGNFNVPLIGLLQC